MAALIPASAAPQSTACAFNSSQVLHFVFCDTLENDAIRGILLQTNTALGRQHRTA